MVAYHTTYYRDLIGRADPEIGRFINADVFTSTGQGLLGNNMFAYCNNNPVNSSDRDGEHSDSYFGWLGEEIGVFLYEWITGTDHPSKQTKALENQMVSTQNKMISDATNYIFDAYIQSNKIQQESQLREAQMMLDIAKQTYDYFEEHDDVASGVSGAGKVAKGVFGIGSGVALIIAPIPTPADDLVGIRKISYGIFNLCYGAAEIVGVLMR